MQPPASPPGIWVLLPTCEHYTTDHFSSTGDHCEWLCTPLCGCQLVGTVDESEVGSHDFCPLVTNFHVWVIMQDNWTPFLRQGCGGMLRHPTGHDIPSNHVKHHCWTQKGVWPCQTMGTPPASPLLKSRGGSPQTCVAGGWKHRLGIGLGPAEQCPILCTLIKQGPCQCHNRWCTLQRSLQSPPPAAGMQTIIA